ncbi:uncharacterized protein M421DRAFT_315661 [Didymella exigua CBS 183.55]|uniref:Uncharacterized protein n=1 Tax=Didymella exigua CBS 183.55 TaxID=1150837 RepID=A0A6A5RUP7_9PLEO|nr:uncharacterized protein M421DRAFT_315661 [Didymella exigua CBS 183.55]KAF1931582.1 hypothetical protein M421DRAFT_315661 [Didymella exigua CBS 183.55]
MPSAPGPASTRLRTAIRKKAPTLSCPRPHPHTRASLCPFRLTGSSRALMRRLPLYLRPSAPRFKLRHSHRPHHSPQCPHEPPLSGVCVRHPLPAIYAF